MNRDFTAIFIVSLFSIYAVVTISSWNKRSSKILIKMFIDNRHYLHRPITDHHCSTVQSAAALWACVSEWVSPENSRHHWNGAAVHCVTSWASCERERAPLHTLPSDKVLFPEPHVQKLAHWNFYKINKFSQISGPRTRVSTHLFSEKYACPEVRSCTASRSCAAGSARAPGAELPELTSQLEWNSYRWSSHAARAPTASRRADTESELQSWGAAQGLYRNTRKTHTARFTDRNLFKCKIKFTNLLSTGLLVALYLFIYDVLLFPWWTNNVH